jgi:hypothetical protein
MKSRQSFLGGVAFSVAVFAAMNATRCNAQPRRQALLSKDLLRSAVERHLKSLLPLVPFRPAWFASAFVDLAGHGKEQAVVYITGQDWCGTGGCTLLVLTQEDHSYTVVSRVPATRLPIRVLKTKSHGWYDLSVWIQGGGIPRGYEDVLVFDGSGYSGQASSQSEQTPARQMKGTTVLSSQEKESPLHL